MSNIDQITLGELKSWKAKADNLKNIGEWKELGRELRDKHGLTDMEAINILNGRWYK